MQRGTGGEGRTEVQKESLISGRLGGDTANKTTRFARLLLRPPSKCKFAAASPREGEGEGGGGGGGASHPNGCTHTCTAAPRAAEEGHLAEVPPLSGGGGGGGGGLQAREKARKEGSLFCGGKTFFSSTTTVY